MGTHQHTTDHVFPLIILSLSLLFNLISIESSNPLPSPVNYFPFLVSLWWQLVPRLAEARQSDDKRFWNTFQLIEMLISFLYSKHFAVLCYVCLCVLHTNEMLEQDKLEMCLQSSSVSVCVQHRHDNNMSVLSITVPDTAKLINYASRTISEQSITWLCPSKHTHTHTNITVRSSLLCVVHIDDHIMNLSPLVIAVPAIIILLIILFFLLCSQSLLSLFASNRKWSFQSRSSSPRRFPPGSCW